MEQNDVGFCLMYLDRNTGLWNRFDTNSLEGYMLKSLAVFPLNGDCYGTLEDYLLWLKEKRNETD